MITHTIDKLHYSEYTSYLSKARSLDIEVKSFKVIDFKSLTLTLHGSLKSIEKFKEYAKQVDSDLNTINTVARLFP